MAEFKGLLEALGYAEVRTLLNSGNAVFASPKRSSISHARSIATAVEAKFGVTTPVVVKSAARLRAVIDGNPMAPPTADHSRFLVAFGMDTSALKSLEPLRPLARGGARFVITKDAAYLHCPGGLLESRIGEALLGRAGKAVTTRNWATVLKLEMLTSNAKPSIAAST